MSVMQEMKCPSCKSCKKEPRVWRCLSCNQEVQKDHGRNFCQCNASSVDSCSFKCQDGFDGSIPVLVPSNINASLPKLEQLKEINILLMGETGVGKSTFINAFANYISYSTLEEAEQNDIKAFIYSKFSVMTRDYGTTEVEIGVPDMNESMKVGESSTQQCQIYIFLLGNMLLRIIDTPGIGDSRGIEQDKKNFENILNVINNYEYLNGIAILNKPNNARLHVYFRFCISELLTHLHKDAAQNLAFIFTNCRSTFYRVGDTFPMLRKLLISFADESGIDIPLDRQTMYFFDSEAFRFLAALKHGVTFSDDERNQFSASWEKSTRESFRLIQYFESCKPHMVKNTVTLNHARRILNELSKPVVAVVQNIQSNIMKMEQKKREISMYEEYVGEQEKNLEIFIDALEPVPLGYPMTVCTAPSCTKVVNGKVDYCTECHPHCYLRGVQQELINNAALMHCSAMCKSTRHCSVCKCDWSKHMHITYKNNLIRKKVVDSAVENLIKSKKSAIAKTEEFITIVESKIKDQEREQEEIIKTSAELADFLRANAITAFNDATVDYLDLAIREEEIKDNKELVERLHNLKGQYVEEKKRFEELVRKSKTSKTISVEEVHTKLEALYNLPLNGDQLRAQVETIQNAIEVGASHWEKRVFYPCKPNPRLGSQLHVRKMLQFVSNLGKKLTSFINV